MKLTSHEPDGPHQRCPVCGKVVVVVESIFGDAVCPACGSLMWIDPGEAVARRPVSWRLRSVRDADVSGSSVDFEDVAGICARFEEEEVPLDIQRGWMIIWSVWGLLLGLIVLSFDHTPIVAAIWLLAGVAMATLGLKVAKLLAPPIFNWYHFYAPGGVSYGFMTIASLIVGLLPGVVAGAVVGATMAPEYTDHLTAHSGALYGILLGVPGFAFLSAIMIAVMVPPDKTDPLLSRIGRRALMLVSPLFVFPVAWHCFRWFQKGPAGLGGPRGAF